MALFPRSGAAIVASFLAFTDMVEFRDQARPRPKIDSSPSGLPRRRGKTLRQVDRSWKFDWLGRKQEIAHKLSSRRLRADVCRRTLAGLRRDQTYPTARDLKQMQRF